MFTKTPPSPVSKAAWSETKSQQAVVSAVTHDDVPRPAEKNATVLAAANLKTKGVELLLEELASPESVRRATAARALGRLADVAAGPALITALRDANADVAREAAVSLGLLRSAEAVQPLIDVVNNHDGYFHSVVRVAATHSLGQLRDRSAVVPLLNAVRDPIAEASAEAIRALASFPDPRSLPVFLEVIRNVDGFFHTSSRQAAILGLAQFGGEQAACELRFVAANQWEDAAIRAAAIGAIREGSTSRAGT